MKTLSDEELTNLAGNYFAPKGLYRHTKGLPFLGSLECNTKTLIAGQWTELIVEYTVGASGLADGAWIKGTFKFYSDWALFQTSDPKEDNYVSLEYTPGPLHEGQTAATVQSLAVRFDQKGHERPFQKAIIVIIVDGDMNPGDKITVRIGDRRWGSRGTRVQTFVEDKFLMRWYIDPVGTSRFAPIKPDIAFPIKSGPVARVKTITPRVVRPGVPAPLHVHTEDIWGNATADLGNLKAEVKLIKVGSKAEVVQTKTLPFAAQGWTVMNDTYEFVKDGDYDLVVAVSVDASLPIPRPLYSDLHVHSDDTVGTNSTTYNFSYAKEIAGLDVVGYTANDFNITKEKWEHTLEIIKRVDSPGEFVVFPGTEWCGNSAAGGDHNVVFLDDPKTSQPEFPFDKKGNVARSFEWNEDGPAELIPGAWPLDEVYATYAHSPESHLLIPHVGGRRCNLAWHHPQLERLLEIGTAWGLFEWLLRDAVKRGWKLGVSANSDEHRGRCGGGVPGTAVFGTKVGLTGVLADKLERGEVAKALRARRTFATTGERLVGIVRTDNGHLQGDDVFVKDNEKLVLRYSFFGAGGYSSIEAWDASGRILHRDLQKEAETHATASTPRKIRVTWGGARVYDRYREAVWHGSILLPGAVISHIRPFGGVLHNAEDEIKQFSQNQVVFETRTSGDFDGGYVKVGDALKGNPHNPQPRFNLVATAKDFTQEGGVRDDIVGGAGLFVSIDGLLDVPLPKRVEGSFTVKAESGSGGDWAVYFVGREYGGGKVITSPVFIKYDGSSTTQTGFFVNGTAPSSKNPIGNPSFPGSTTTGGLNWLGFDISEFNHTTILAYNLAVGGATTDSTLIPTYTEGVATYVDQVNTFYDAYVHQETSWSWDDVLIGIWIANNDVGQSFDRNDTSSLYPKVSARYFEQTQRLYDAGARNFVFLTCAPQQLTPLMIEKGSESNAKVAAAVKLYNEILEKNFQKFKIAHPDAQAWLVRPSKSYETAIANPQEYGAPDAICTNEDGVSCLWWNNYHPGIQIHHLLGADVATTVGTPWFNPQ
ncbi:Acetylesterase [Colletotrichum fructicola]|nr:Acetylesterase [Colletotrichum fructicola]